MTYLLLTDCCKVADALHDEKATGDSLSAGFMPSSSRNKILGRLIHRDYRLDMGQAQKNEVMIFQNFRTWILGSRAPTSSAPMKTINY